MEISFGGSKSSAGAGKGSGWGIYVFGGIFALVGFFGTIGLLWVFLKNLDTYRWEKTPATIHRCEIDISGGERAPFRMEVDFEYTAGTEVFRSQRYALKDKFEDDYEKLSLARARLRNERLPWCYVDPKDPTRAILKRGTLWLGLLIFLPLIFLAIGVGVIWAAIRQGKKFGMPKRAGKDSISEKAKSKKKMSPVTAAILLGILTAGGLAVLIPFTKAFVLRPIDSKSWVEVPCEIIWSRVQSHDSDDGTTYSVDIFFGYEFDGEQHRSNRYSFTSGSSSGRGGKAAIVSAYPKGSQQICFVNPDLPQQAVIKAGFTPMAFIGLIPLAAVIGGAWGLMRVAGGRGGARNDPWGTRSEISGGVREFTPGNKRVITAVVVLLIALVWNGIVSVFLADVIGGWKRGSPDWFQTLFFIPFGVVGLGLIAGFLYSLLGIFNPAPIIRLRPGRVKLGEPATLEWEMLGASGRIRQFRIWIQGVESATYRRGTNTVTDEEIFYCVEAVSTPHVREMARGSIQFTLPHDSMCSFNSGNNKITWRMMIEGEIGLWPDVSDSHEMEIEGSDTGVAQREIAASAP